MRSIVLSGLFIITAIVVSDWTLQYVEATTKPHIIFLLADDLGYNDVSYHGRSGHSAIQTPNIDKLASSGVTLENYYVQPICSPTRSQLMSGRYQIHTGLMHSVISPASPSCLPLDEVTLPQKLKESGYATHIVGKWHLGFYKAASMPTNRGFDSHLGYLLGAEDYYRHDCQYSVGNVSMNGYDFRNNTSPATEYKGEYSLFTFVKNVENIIEMRNSTRPLFLYVPFQNVHGPLEVPKQYLEPYSGITHNRQTYAGMTSALDEAVGNITKKLKDKGLYDNSVIIFSTDNGGPVESANNWPLRGSKGTLWEGGIRGVGLVHSPLLSPKVVGKVSREFIHVSDWFPTLVEGVAGGNLNGTKPLDGFNVWNSIAYGEKSPRTELLHNIDPLYGLSEVSDEWTYEDQRMYDEMMSQLKCTANFSTSLHAALRVGDWKILTGPQGSKEYWYAPPESNLTPIKPIVDAKQKVWLFNITADPYERHDLSQKYPDVVKSLLEKLDQYWSSSVPVQYPPPDVKADPKLHGGYWGPWST